MPTDKTLIIEDLFHRRYSSATGTLSNPVVTLEDVSLGITRFNSTNPPRPMSTRNPANFFKDFIRNRESVNKNWPATVLSAGFTGRQVTRGNACFEFISLPPGQTDAFPASNFAKPTGETPRHFIESVSLPLASRRLGRNDEPWLIQVIARLRVVEAHFSLVSRRQIRQLDLLQMSVKLAGTEIDALFLAQEEISPNNFQEVIITCEAKQGRDDILEDQILRQAKAPFSMKQITQDHVIPIAVKCVAPSEIFVVEFQELDRDTYSTVTSIAIASDSVFEIKPPVPGICD